MSGKVGIIFINIGTPKSLSTKDVAFYLREFLSDRRVIDINPILRFLLVNLIIAPFRSFKSKKAYAEVWTDKGSPLLSLSESFLEKVKARLPQNVKAVFAMRYGQPSLKSAVDDLKDCAKIIIFPMYPQYASASTGSSIEKTFDLFKKKNQIPAIHTFFSFYNKDFYINSFVKIIEEHRQKKPFDFLLMSYHGLPERQLAGETLDSCRSCDRIKACPKISLTNQYCYRAQCYETSKLIAHKLGLEDDAWTVSFQSRLGKTPWIKPYTDILLPELAKKNKKNLAVVCPSFTTDCLETLEEIGLQAKSSWMENGGESFSLISCLNDDTHWVDSLTDELIKTF